MKLRLVLRTITDKNKDVVIKFNIAPSQHLGFINFINLCLDQDNPVEFTFEKISKSGKKEESKISGTFQFEAKDKKDLKELKKELEKKQDHKK
ncbi:MAG: hypothetical protein EU547_00655 [Promethearchaeota archaeon]|nr:MAG: hypothetical protein EU547_00655 [Candidatus Lokiarchaeota archaeon]